LGCSNQRCAHEKLSMCSPAPRSIWCVVTIGPRTPACAGRPNRTSGPRRPVVRQECLQEVRKHHNQNCSRGRRDGVEVRRGTHDAYVVWKGVGNSRQAGRKLIRLLHPATLGALRPCRCHAGAVSAGSCSWMRGATDQIVHVSADQRPLGSVISMPSAKPEWRQRCAFRREVGKEVKVSPTAPSEYSRFSTNSCRPRPISWATREPLVERHVCDGGYAEVLPGIQYLQALIVVTSWRDVDAPTTPRPGAHQDVGLPGDVVHQLALMRRLRQRRLQLLDTPEDCLHRQRISLLVFIMSLSRRLEALCNC